MAKENPFDDVEVTDKKVELNLGEEAPLTVEEKVPKAVKVEETKAPAKEQKVRRTKEEKLQDDIKAAAEMLMAQGFVVTLAAEDQEWIKDNVERDVPDFSRVEYDKFPLSAVSGQVAGSVKLNGAVPILEIALLNWIGEAPVALAASDIGDVENVLNTLRAQAVEHLSE